MAANRTRAGAAAAARVADDRDVAQQPTAAGAAGVVARSVIVDEVTQGYERIHATVSYRVLHGAVESSACACPPALK